MSKGHLFVVRADVTTILCDGWLVPGDADGPGDSWLRRYAFGPLLEGQKGRVKRCTAAANDPRVPWLVDLAGDSKRKIDWYIGGVRDFLQAATQHRTIDRAVPLYALPLVGTGGGGAKARTGELTSTLVPALIELADEFAVDLALCLWSKAHYAAAQRARERAAKRNANVWHALPAHMHHAAKRVGDDAIGTTDTRLVLFIGAGVSQNAGLPGWNGLLQGLAKDLGLSQSEQDDLEEIRDPLARAEAIRAVAECDEAALKQKVTDRIEAHRAPSLCHTLLASLPVDESITTNYDRLLELAHRPHRHDLRVLPYQSVSHKSPWLLKLHGTTQMPDANIARGDDIILTRTDYARFDLRWRALASIVETLLVTRHMLFVGFSLDDPNFQRMVDTVRRAVAERGVVQKRIGTILEVNKTPYLEKVWGDEFHVVPMGVGRKTDIAGQARHLEIFLDRIGAHAAPQDAYLLDDDALGLLDDDERQLRDCLGRFIDDLNAQPDIKQALAKADDGALGRIRMLLGDLGWREAQKSSRGDS